MEEELNKRVMFQGRGEIIKLMEMEYVKARPS